MDKRQMLMSELMDVCNEIIWVNKPILESILDGYTLNELQTIEYIAKIPKANVTKLADASYMTRGAISKLTKKLLKRNIIESYQEAGNKKEVYFKLAKEGEDVYKSHQKIHKQFLLRDKEVFEGMKDEEYDILFRFVGKYREHLKKIKHK